MEFCMRTVYLPPVSSAMPLYREPASAETEVRARVLVWCSAWSSVNGAFQTDTLRGIAAPGPVRLAADFGRDVAVCASFEEYAAFWSPLLTQTFSDWTLIADPPIEVRVQDGMAAATFSSRFHGISQNGRSMSQRQRVLQVWEKFDGVWRLSHEQTTVDSEGACM